MGLCVCVCVCVCVVCDWACVFFYPVRRLYACMCVLNAVFYPYAYVLISRCMNSLMYSVCHLCCNACNVTYCMGFSPYTIFTVETLPWELRKLLKWRMSPITPNVVKNCIARSGFRATKSKWHFYHSQNIQDRCFTGFLVIDWLIDRLIDWSISRLIIVCCYTCRVWFALVTYIAIRIKA